MQPASRKAYALVAALVALGATDSAADADPRSPACAADVARARFELDERVAEEQLAPIRREADEAIHDLLEPLWKAKSTERLRYLAARRTRDVSRVRVARAAVARRRAEARLEVLETECNGGDGDASEALGRYEALECELLAKDRRIAEIDRDFQRELLESRKVLRSQQFATEQELVEARFGLERAESRVRTSSQRLATCRRRTKAPR